MRKIDQNYYRDNINQRARGKGIFQLNGSNNYVNLSSAITHPPKEVEFKAITNWGNFLTILGIIATAFFYLVAIGFANIHKNTPIFGIKLGFFIYIPTILIIGLFVVLVILATDWLSFKLNSSHAIYRDKTIIYGGRIHRFYDEIWDIKLGNKLSDKVIYCYWVNSLNGKKIRRLRLRFQNEEHAKYLYDVFHAGKYLKNEG